MIKKGVNFSDLKTANRKNILMAIKNFGAIPRKDISDIISLTPAAVTIITNEMKEEGILVERGRLIETDKRIGRKKILIDINYNFKYIVGISIESDTVGIGLCNLKGDVLDNRQFDIPQEDRGYGINILQFISHTCSNLFLKYNVKKHDILGIGIGIIGSVDILNGISKDSYGIFEKNFPIKELFEKQFNIPVCIDNNVRALAMAEIDLKSSQFKENNMIFVKYGPGIGTAIIINNEIYQGSNNNAGELGHIIVKQNGQLCKCGKRGCLETVASQNAIFSSVRKIFSRSKTPFLFEITEGNPENINLLNIVRSSQNGDENITDILNKAMFYFSSALSTAITLYDPKQVVLYGEAFNYDFFIDKLKLHLEYITDNANITDIISISKIEYNYKFLGGAALALRNFFYNRGGKSLAKYMD
ncbi:ROK family transcriptional regulator [Clostridium sp. LBM24168]